MYAEILIFLLLWSSSKRENTIIILRVCVETELVKQQTPEAEYITSSHNYKSCGLKRTLDTVVKASTQSTTE